MIGGQLLIPIIITGNQGEMVPNGWASNTNRGKNAKISIALIRAAYGFSPVL